MLHLSSGRAVHHTIIQPNCTAGVLEVPSSQHTALEMQPVSVMQNRHCLSQQPTCNTVESRATTEDDQGGAMLSNRRLRRQERWVLGGLRAHPILPLILAASDAY